MPDFGPGFKKENTMSWWKSLIEPYKSNQPRFAGSTDIGCKRKENQDGWCRGPVVGEELNVRGEEAGAFVSPGWLAVADGMGGAKGGDVASRRALEIVSAALPATDGTTGNDSARLAVMEQALREAHATLEAEANADSDLTGMGCTFSGLWWPTEDPGLAIMGQVGDSRIYRWRDGELTQLTRDQTVVQRLIDEGSMTLEEAERTRFSSVLEFALGANGGDLQPQVEWVDFADRDVVLICSDGLHGVVSDTDLARILPGRPQADLLPICHKLIAAARDAGGPDNITAVLGQVGTLAV